MKPELVQFSSHPSSFRVDFARCITLDCECSDVVFRFREEQEALADAKPMKFEVRIDGLTWKEIGQPPRPPEIERMAQEFLRDYPLAERRSIRQSCEEKIRGARRLKECRLDPQSTTGRLVAFGELLHGRPDGMAGPEWFDIFDHEGETYLVDDLYCANPECNCEKAHLAFIRHAATDIPGAPPERDFLVDLPFDGRAQIRECHGCTPSTAEAVFSAWQEQYGTDLEELKWRYSKLKEIARRSLPERIAVPRPFGFSPPDSYYPTLEPLAIGFRVGRNEPCPCGSGKKFKRCCGLSRAG
jgi:hypothetical protein